MSTVAKGNWIHRRGIRLVGRRPSEGGGLELPFQAHARGRGTQGTRHAPMFICVLMAVLVFPGIEAFSQSGGTRAQGNDQSAAAAPESQPARNPAAESRPAAASPASHPAQVLFQNGNLTIVASQSGLEKILEQLHAEMGIRFEGKAENDLVSGKFGPGIARDVIESLLRKTGYSYILVGDGTRYSLSGVVIVGKDKAADEEAKSSQPAPAAPASGGADAGTPTQPAAADAAVQAAQPAAAEAPSADGSPYVGGNPDSASVQQSHDQLRGLKQQQSQQQSASPSTPPQR
jgi:hypothetical protein